MPDRAFVGRQSQLAVLQTHLESALVGESVVGFVCGEPGAGKTSLLQAFARDAQAGNPQLLVAAGACDSFTGSGDAYLPFREILRLLTGDVEESLAEGRASAENASRLQAFMRKSARALVENGPDLVDIFVPGGALLARLGGKAASRLSWAERLVRKISDDGPAGAEISQENIFEQYVQVLEAMAERQPLMLIVDDLHWADKASLGLLFHLARRLVNDPVFILGAFRRDALAGNDDTASLQTMLGELKRIYGDIVVDLGAAADDDFSEALLDTRRNRFSAAFRRTIARHTAGNPLFINELIDHLLAQGVVCEGADGVLEEAGEIDWSELPSRIAGVMEARLARLGDNDRELVDIASVHGDEFYAETISRVMECRPRAVVRTLSKTLQRQLDLVRHCGVKPLGPMTLSAYTFRHNLFQAYLYNNLDEAERVLLHGEIAAVLEDMATQSTAELSLVLARHFHKAGNHIKAASFYVAAGDHAAAVHAPESAIAHYQLALDLRRVQDARQDGFDSCRILESLGDQLMLAGHWDEGLAAFDDALAATSDDLVSMRLLRKTSMPLQRKNDFAGALERLADALEKHDASAKPDAADWQQEWLETQLQYCWIHYWRNEREALQTRIEALTPVEQKWGTDSQKSRHLIAQVHLGLRTSRYRADDELVALDREVYKHARNTPAQAGDTFLLGFVLLWAGRFREALSALETAHDIVRKVGDVVTKTRILVYRTVAHRCLGETGEVSDLLPLAGELAEFVGSADYRGVLLSQDAWLARRAGNLDLARAKALSAIEVWERDSPRYPFQWLGRWLIVAQAHDDADLDLAASHARIMLEPPQMKLPDTVEAPLAAFAASAPDAGDTQELRKALEAAAAHGLL